MEEDLELIENYLAGTLPDEQRREVEDRMKSDIAFASRVKTVRSLKIAIPIDTEGFREDLSAVMDDRIASVRGGRTRILLMIAASVAILAVAIVVFNQLKHPAPQDLYAENFSVPVENFSIRDNGTTDDMLSKAVEAYNRGNFSEAYSYFSQVPESGESVHFYSGICLMMMNRNQEAVEKFNEVLAAGSEVLNSGATWYKGLAFLKMNEIDSAKVQFARLSSIEASSYSERSSTILQELE